MSHIWHWLAWTWGDRHPGQGAGYAIFSGPLPDLTMLGIGGAFWRKHNCHIRGCWRLSWKQTAAGDHVCRKHHPDDQPTHAEALSAHHQALAGGTGPEPSKLGG